MFIDAKQKQRSDHGNLFGYVIKFNIVYKQSICMQNI